MLPIALEMLEDALSTIGDLDFAVGSSLESSSATCHRAKNERILRLRRRKSATEEVGGLIVPLAANRTRDESLREIAKTLKCAPEDLGWGKVLTSAVEYETKYAAMPKTTIDFDALNEDELLAQIVELHVVRNAFRSYCSEASTPNENTVPKTAFTEYAEIINDRMPVLSPETVHQLTKLHHNHATAALQVSPFSRDTDPTLKGPTDGIAHIKSDAPKNHNSTRAIQGRR